MGRYWSVLLLAVACSSGEQEVDGSGGASSVTTDVVSAGGVSGTGGSSGRTVATATTGGKTSVATPASYGGATRAATSAMGGVTSLGGTTSAGGTMSNSTSISECLFNPERPNEGSCSVYSKGRFYCLLGACTPSDLSTGYRLDCDHDGTPETSQSTDDNCGACGNSCRELFLHCKTMGYNEPWYECQ